MKVPRIPNPVRSRPPSMTAGHPITPSERTRPPAGNDPPAGGGEAETARRMEALVIARDVLGTAEGRVDVDELLDVAERIHTWLRDGAEPTRAVEHEQV